jgi:integrase
VYVTPERNHSGLDTRRWFEDCVKAARLEPPFHFKDLRHSFATRASAAGISILEIQKYLGHKRHTTTLKYAHVLPDHLKRSVELVGRLSAEGASGEKGRKKGRK